MRKLFALAASALLFSVTAALADPVGKYVVEGTNPGSDKSYSGTVSVERTGQTYRVVWVVGGDMQQSDRRCNAFSKLDCG